MICGFVNVSLIDSGLVYNLYSTDASQNIQKAYCFSAGQQAQTRGDQGSSSQQRIKYPSLYLVFLNPKHMVDNKKAFDRMRLLTTILAGVLSGLLNLNQLEGPFLYFGVHLVLTLLIFLKIDKVESYFKGVGSLFEGMGSGVLLFICVWMIVVNVVYVL